VAVKWVVPEDGTPAAIALLRDAMAAQTAVIAPPHARAEVTSALHRRVRLGEMDQEVATARAHRFEEIPLLLVEPPGLMAGAIDLAIKFGWKNPYDALYLALGELLDCDVWTADADFHGSAHETYPRLRLLSDFAPA
jgi:predicted nucleic acid-binding protein